MTEKVLQRKVKKELEARGCLVYKFDSTSQAGVPDLIVMGNGRVEFIELKHPNGQGKVSELQALVHRRMLARGIQVHVEHTLQGCLHVCRKLFS